MGEVTITAMPESSPVTNSDKLPHVTEAAVEEYDSLRSLGRHLQKRYGSRWADPTSLIHRAYIRLAENDQVDCVSLSHARGRLSRAMRSCLIDLIRREARCIHVGEGFIFAARSTDEILAVNDGLSSLAMIDSVQAEIVERRYFGGFQWSEVAKDMDMSVSTAKRNFRLAKAWLKEHWSD